MTAFLSNQQINLRPVRRTDLDLLAEWRNDPDIRRATREWRALTEADQEHWFQRISGPDRRDHMFVVERAADGLPVGVVGLVHWSPTDGTAEISFFIGRRDARGQGYARGALDLLLTWGFDVMRLERVSAETYEFNDASFGLLTSLGFVVEGRLRSHVHRDSRRWDANILGLLRDEWRGPTEPPTEAGPA
jgi:RimJ/RimL family protein N-acetyltransferase